VKRSARLDNPEAQWFGFERVDADRKTTRVGEVFSSVAPSYDLMNDVMSMGAHRFWKDAFVSLMRPRAGEVIVDVAGGTGDIALRIARVMGGRCSLAVCDINSAMVRAGRDKAIDRGWLDEIEWVAGSAESLPFADESVDLLSIAFGLRNVTRIDTALAEFYRVLKRGGRFFCMEFSPSSAPPLRPFYDLYSFSVLPWLGEHIAGDRSAYLYLAESIRRFPAPKVLAARMKRAGFDPVRCRAMTGGIVAVHSGWKT